MFRAFYGVYDVLCYHCLTANFAAQTLWMPSTRTRRARSHSDGRSLTRLTVTLSKRCPRARTGRAWRASTTHRPRRISAHAVRCSFCVKLPLCVVVVGWFCVTCFYCWVVELTPWYGICRTSSNGFVFMGLGRLLSHLSPADLSGLDISGKSFQYKMFGI